MGELIKKISLRDEYRLRLVMLHSIIAQQVNAHHGRNCCDHIIGSMASGHIEIVTYVDGKEVRVIAEKTLDGWKRKSPLIA